MDTNARLQVERHITADCESKHTENMWGKPIPHVIVHAHVYHVFVSIYSKTVELPTFFFHTDHKTKPAPGDSYIILSNFICGVCKTNSIHTFCWFIAFKE